MQVDLAIALTAGIFNTMLNFASPVVFLSQYFDKATLKEIGIAMGMFVVMLVALWVIKKMVLVQLHQLAKRTKFKADDVLIRMFEEIGGLFFFVVALYVSVQHLELPDMIDTGIKAAFLAVLIYEAIKITESLVIFALNKSIGSKRNAKQMSTAMQIVVKIFLWMAGVLLLISNLGFNVNSLIASLGIGGLAVSFALQNILEDIFSSFSILIDKPFEEGDYIVIGEQSGVVKRVGLKTTRIETLLGDELVVPNTELTNSRVQNFKKMKERRVNFQIGVTYDTSTTKLEKLPGMIKNIIEETPNVRYDRAHFFEMADFNLVFDIVYYVSDSDYQTYMDAQQSINLEIMKECKKSKIEFAFPTQTVYLEK